MGLFGESWKIAVCGFFYLKKYQGLGWAGNLLVEALGEDRMLLAVADCSSKSIIPWNRAAPRVDGEEIKPQTRGKKDGFVFPRGAELTPATSLYAGES